MDEKVIKNEKQIRVAFYFRVSTEEQKEKFGLDMQRQSLDSYLKSRGKFEDGRDKMVLAGEEYIYTDDGVSGTVPIHDRGSFARLIEDLERADDGRKPFDAVAVYKVDRFARKLVILLDIIALLDKHKIQFISVNESIDTSTPFGRAILGIMGVIAELEVETTKMRTQGGREQAFKRGTVSIPIYGYSKDINKQYKVFEVEAKIIRQIFNLFIYDGKSTSEIAALLTDQKVPSPEESAFIHQKRKGKSRKINAMFFWKRDTVGDILKNEVYIGNYYYNKTKNEKRLDPSEWIQSDHHHEPIIELMQFQKAKEMLRASADRIPLNTKRPDDTLYLLSGLLKCGYCSDKDDSDKHSWNGERDKIGTNPDKYSYRYKCGHKQSKKFTTTCPTIPIPAEQLENYITAFVLTLLTNPKMAFDYQNKLNSNKITVKTLKEERRKIIKLVNEMPNRSKNILTQHEHSYLTDSELEIKQGEIISTEKKYKTRLDEIGKLLGQQELSEGYTNNFVTYAKKYSAVLNDIHKDKKELYALLHSMIDKIIIYTRPADPKFDRVAGVRKENQQIPNSILIKLKLPDVLLTELNQHQLKKMAPEFGAKPVRL